ncbi:MAG TPA: nitroreductase family deazaflavin-dependent oxidoreductase [Gaiellaceae bacterium]|nr:nitroreductase family deazaflavin-dependent oxidoreductase [Gaiellaceae bacterium]
MTLFGQEHVQRYQETDGAEGHDWLKGTTTLLLTTTGRKSGKQYTTPLIYTLDGGNPVIVASQGGTPDNPDWYLNLIANPHVDVQIKGEKFHAHPHTVEGEERERLWKQMAAVWPDYDEYQKKTDREIPVVVLDRG